MGAALAVTPSLAAKSAFEPFQFLLGGIANASRAFFVRVSPFISNDSARCIKLTVSCLDIY